MSWKAIPYNKQHRTSTTRSHTSNIVPERLAERVWWTRTLRYGSKIPVHTTTVAEAWRSIFSDFKFGAASPRYKHHAIWNHGSYVWTKALSCMVFLSAQPARAINRYPVSRENELRERIPVPHDNFLNLFKVRARAAKVTVFIRLTALGAY